jgi:hypothetical protein
MVNSIVENGTGKTLLRQEVSNEMRQYGDDLWGCSKFTKITYDSGGNKVNEVTVIYDADFKINVPVTDHELQIKLPSGIEVWDAALDMSYEVP